MIEVIIKNRKIILLIIFNICINIYITLQFFFYEVISANIEFLLGKLGGLNAKPVEFSLSGYLEEMELYIKENEKLVLFLISLLISKIFLCSRNETLLFVVFILFWITFIKITGINEVIIDPMIEHQNDGVSKSMSPHPLNPGDISINCIIIAIIGKMKIDSHMDK